MSDPSGVRTHVSAWLALASTAVTIVVTGINAYWSNESTKKAQALNALVAEREQDLKLAQQTLEASKDRMSRFGFVQDLMPQLLSTDIGQQTVAINLIRLSLTTDEAAAFFKGLEISNSPQLAIAGERAGDSTLDLLIAQLDDRDKVVRGSAVDMLAARYPATPAAIDKALAMLEGAQLAALQPEGRINVLIFLKRTSPSAWSPDAAARGRQAIANIRARAAGGISAVGPQTQGHLVALDLLLDKVAELQP